MSCISSSDCRRADPRSGIRCPVYYDDDQEAVMNALPARLRYDPGAPDPDPEPVGAGWFALLLLLLVLVAFLLAASARGQEVLHPAYGSTTAREIMAVVPKGSESRVWLIFNINSGPAVKLSIGQRATMDEARRRGFKVVYYLDLMGGGLYSPVLASDGSNYKEVQVKQPRAKSADELAVERSAWLRYGAPEAWFLDDVNNQTRSVLPSLASWCKMAGTPRLMLNAGCALTPPPELASAVVVISEQARAWPRSLTPWEAAHRRQCAVLGLAIREADLPRFKSSTATLGFRWASPQDDPWQSGRSAYNSATPWLKALLE